MAKRSKFLTAITLVTAMTVAGTAHADPMADQVFDPTRVSEGAIVLDALIARPLLAATTLAGTALFVVASPFTLAGGTTAETWNTLVVTPAAATFTRCIGCTPAQHERVVALRRSEEATRAAAAVTPAE